MHFAKKASIGICFPPLEDFSFFLGEGVVVEHCFSASFFLGEGVVEHCFSASLAKKTDNGSMKQPFMFKQGRKLKFIKLINHILILHKDCLARMRQNHNEPRVAATSTRILPCNLERKQETTYCEAMSKHKYLSLQMGLLLSTVSFRCRDSAK